MSSYRKRESLRVGSCPGQHQLSWTPLGRRASFLVIGGEDARMCGYKDKLEIGRRVGSWKRWHLKTSLFALQEKIQSSGRERCGGCRAASHEVSLPTCHPAMRSLKAGASWHAVTEMGLFIRQHTELPVLLPYSLFFSISYINICNQSYHRNTFDGYF